MTKSTEKPNSPDAYDTYLANLISEIEEHCAPLTVDRSDGAISLNLPPIPPDFELLDDDAVTNIRWVVQTYFDYLKPLGADKIRKRANALYALAQDSTKNRGEDEKDPRNVERNLTTTMLANRREAMNKDAHLHFYMLMLMQTGLLRHQLIDGMSDTIKICHQIDLSFSEARNRHRPYREKERAARKRAKALDRQNNAEPRMYALMRYPQLCGSVTAQGKVRSKSQIADIIIKEINELCQAKEIKGNPPTKRVLTERWLPKNGK